MGMFDMLKQAAEIRRQVKQVESELKKIEVEESAKGITVKVRGDMYISQIIIDPSLMGKDPQSFSKLLVDTINRAIDSARKKAASFMARSGGIEGLSKLFG